MGRFFAALACFALGVLVTSLAFLAGGEAGEDMPPTVVIESPPTTLAPFCERWHC